MTDTEFSALEAAAKAATPGPWEESFDDVLVHRYAILCECRTLKIKNVHIDMDGKKNAAYIAAANPAAILELIAELRQARAERNALINYIVEHGGCPISIWDKCPAEQDDPILCKDCWLKSAAKEATKCK